MIIPSRVGAVEAKQEAKAIVEFTPIITGSTVLLVSFDSNKLSNIKGFLTVEIKS